MTRLPWHDIEMRGRKLDAISKQMNTKFWTNADDNPELALSYLDRMLKIEQTLQPYIQSVTGVKRLLKKIKKYDQLSDKYLK